MLVEHDKRYDSRSFGTKITKKKTEVLEIDWVKLLTYNKYMWLNDNEQCQLGYY